jgi:parallel beta-helix repeat protein
MALTTVKGAVLNRGVNVKDYGAKGDGVTDDTAAIQAAMDAASNVYFPAGTYLVGAALVPNTNQYMWGTGATIKLADSTNTSIISADGASNITIEGLSLDGNKANQSITKTDSTKAVIYLTDTSNATQVTKNNIVNCKIINAGSDGVCFGASTYSGVSDCYIEAPAQHGISTIGGSILQTEFCTFSHNRIKGGETGADGAGIIVMGTARFCSITGNTITDTGIYGDGITAYAQVNHGHSITGNVIKNSHNHGIHIGGDHITVSGNTINEVALTASGASGILVESQSTDPAAQFITLSGNTVYCTNANVGAGIDIQDRANNVVVSGNNIRNTATIGIRLNDGSLAVVSGNQVSGSGTIGIDVSSYIRVNIEGNIISNTNQDGIDLTGAAQSIVSGNFIFNSGVSVGGGTGFAIKADATSTNLFIQGNMMRETSESSLVSLDTSINSIVCESNYMTDGSTHEAAIPVASASTINLPAHSHMFEITGTTTITTINGMWEGRVVILRFASTAQVTDGGNINLAGNFTGSGSRILTLMSQNGTSWHEVSRSSN